MKQNNQKSRKNSPDETHENMAEYNRDYLTTRDAADMLGVSLGTIQKMVESGELVAWKTAGGHRRIKFQSVEKYLRMNCNIANYVSRRHVSILMVGATHEVRSHYLNQVNAWNLPLRLHFVDDEFHLLMRVLQLNPDIILLDADSEYCPCWRMVSSLRSHELTGNTDVLVLGDAKVETTPTLSDMPYGVVVFPKPLSFELLRGYLSAKIAAKLNDTR